ncbi:MAG: PDZ domain-containing protein [Acidimicrobiales bacterium]
MTSDFDPLDGLSSGEDLNLAGRDEALRRLRRRSWLMVGFGFVFVVSLISAIGFIIRPSYVAIVPGSVCDTEPLVSVEGVATYPSEGELDYTTVRLRQDMDLWTYLYEKWKGDGEFIDADTYFGTLTPDENREINLERMTSAKDTAIAVALDQLGFDTISDAGVVVAQVVENSPAVGLLEVGDVLSSINGEPITSDVQLVERLSKYRPGDVATFEVTRGAEAPQEISVTLGERPDDGEAGFIGISPATLADISDPPFEIDIDSGSVGGRRPGSRSRSPFSRNSRPVNSRGAKVAITGTIGIDGTVGPIGGIEQKAVAVRESGAAYFIVPSSQQPEELEVVRERVGDGVEVIEVDSLDAALEALGRIGGDVQAVEEFAMAQG